MDLGLTDKVILVSGGGSGIGRAIAERSVAEGCLVVVAGRDTPDVRAFERQAGARHSGRVAFFFAELADPAHCEQAIRFAESHFGGLYGLVNNAGANDNVGLGSGDPQRFEESLRQNLLHYYSLTHFALGMLQASRGAIVNISSKVAVTGQGGTSGYAASKGAQLALTREWAAELLPSGVRVNAVVPAEVLTPLYQQWLTEYASAVTLQDIGQRVPLGRRLTQPEEVASAAVFLLSPTQSGHTTGQHIFVDGGYTHLDRALTGPASEAKS